MQVAVMKNKEWLTAYSLIWKFFDLIYPPECIACGKIGYRCCPSCWEKRERYDENICSICGNPFQPGSFCDFCLPPSSPLEKVRSVGEYEGILRIFILALKYQRNIGLAELILPDLIQVITKAHFEFDLIIPVPLSKIRQRERGYNQVTLWGRLLSKSLNLPLSSSALKRERNTESQVNLSAGKREENIRNAFSANADFIHGKNILLLDDVITTGATLNECARTLKDAGAFHISALTIARSSKKEKNNQGGRNV